MSSDSAHPGRATDRPLGRRTALGGLAGALALAGCSAEPGGGTGPAPGDPGGSTPGARDRFPVRIEHAFGATRILEPPRRIVTVGLTDHDALLALGIVPVGVTRWYGKHVIWPWARHKLDGAKPTVVGNSTNLRFERIAAQRPDAILALYAGLTSREYEVLSDIAPTVAPPAGYAPYGIPWQRLTRTVGQVVGRPGRARQLVGGVRDRFAAARAEHPEFAGATAVIATPYQGIYVYGPESANSRVLSALGFTLPGWLEDVAGGSFGGNLSPERMGRLDVDALVWLDAKEGKGPLGQALYRELTVHTERREVLLDSLGDLGGLSFVSVLSLPTLLDHLVPMLAAAVDGDPATDMPAP